MRSAAAFAVAPLGLFALGGLLAPGALAATPSTPAWNLQALAEPTNFTPGDESLARYSVFIANSGAKATDGSPITITDTLPEGLGVKSVTLRTSRQPFADFGPSACETQALGEVSTVTCTLAEGALPGAEEPALLYPSEQVLMTIGLKVPPTASGPLTNLVVVEGGGAEAAFAESHNQASGEEASAGLQAFQSTPSGADGRPTTGAASHPYQHTIGFALNLNSAAPGSEAPFVPANGSLKGVEAALPPGLIINPTATPRCTAQQFNTVHGATTESGLNYTKNECPDGSAVGLVTMQLEGAGRVGVGTPLYNLVPPKGMPAQFGFQPAFGLPAYADTELRSDGDYGISVRLNNVTEAKRVTAAGVTIWGTPAHPSHDRLRGNCALAGGLCPAGLPITRPFLRLPSSCADPLATRMSFNTWSDPGLFLEAAFAEAAPVGCELPPFDPSIEAKPTTNVADAPSGFHFNLHLPQKENEDPEGLGEADLRDASVTLPEGFLVNPAAADGLTGCSVAEIGLSTPVGQSPPHFSAAPPSCPDASKLGSVQVHSPLFDHLLSGSVFLARPHENPFDSLLAIYIVVNDPQSGVVVKLAGRVQVDPLTGQLTTIVKGSPQIPFEDLELDLFEGARAPLRTPALCGTHTTATSLTPWTSPAFGPDATPSDSFEIVQGPVGGSCSPSAAARPNSPRFEAGTATPIAGAYSPFILRLARADGSQELKGLDLTLPAGLSGRLAGLSYCSEAALAAAKSKPGKAEQASSSCPASSEIGTLILAAGAGPAPLYVGGKAYLAGPYKGAPISIAAITPAVAGPFDLGTVLVRTALHVDPETTRIRAVSDPIPRSLEGIPLDLRSIALRVDRDRFSLNPTSCNPMGFTGQATSALGQSAALNQRFQVGGCADLPFGPKLSLRLKGGAKRGDHPALTATLTMPPGGANLAKAQLALPDSQLLDQAQIKVVCSRAQFAANACPKGAIYGHARAITPLLERPLSGPVYLRSSERKLPDLAVDLAGQIEIVLSARTDSVKGGARSTFEGIPDVPISKLLLSLKGGRRGFLINRRNTCKGKHRASASFTAHSGKARELRPLLKAKCKGHARHRRGQKGSGPNGNPKGRG